MQSLIPLLYRCKAGHFHIVMDMEKNISPPFETKRGFDMLLTFLKPTTDIDEDMLRVKRQHLSQQAIPFCRAMRRDKRGRYLRTDMLLGDKRSAWEGDTFAPWIKLAEGSGDVGYVVWGMGQCFWMPLLCDFIHREGWRDDMNPLDIGRLNLPARLMTAKEIGITLEIKK
ncbi:MAG: hypothetical protein AAB663_01585 [Patescibacteria group bacterium]